jgi:hypothetical protein
VVGDGFVDVGDAGDVDDDDFGAVGADAAEELVGELLGAWAVEDADDGRDEESFADLEDGVDSSRMESCCWRMTRSRCSTKLTATVLAMRLAAGS